MELLTDVVTPVEAILRRCDSVDVVKHYCVPDYSDTIEFLSLLARKIGRLKKG